MKNEDKEVLLLRAIGGKFGQVKLGEYTDGSGYCVRLTNKDDEVRDLVFPMLASAGLEYEYGEKSYGIFSTDNSRNMEGMFKNGRTE